MALSASTVWEVRNGGSDTNGGGFVTGSGGTDYSLQTAAQLTVTDAACTGNTTVTSATGGFTAAMVGNIMYLSSGPGWYQITAYTDTNTVTIDRNGPTDTGMTANVGGALASPGQAASIMVDGNICYVKYNATSYTISSNTVNVSGGRIEAVADRKYIGYDTTRTTTNVDANRPTLLAGTTLTNFYSQFNGFSRRNWFRNFILDGNSTTTTGAVSSTDSQWFDRIKVFSCTTGITGFYITRCEAYSCSGTGIGSTVAWGCVSHDNGYGFNQTDCYWCVSYDNSTGYYDPGFGHNFVNCIAVNNSGNGFENQSDNRYNGITFNCIAWNNGGNGFYHGENHPVFNCAGGSNTSGTFLGSAPHFGSVTLTVNPFNDSANGDFSLNNLTGGGADLRGVGFPGIFPDGLTTSYLDIGAAQVHKPSDEDLAAAMWNYANRTLT